MPYKSEKIKLNESQDRRIKLTQEQKKTILNTYRNGGGSLRELARQYNVSHKLILIIVNPQSLQKNKDYIKQNWKKYQIFREERSRVMREHRKYKQELYLKGKLKNNEHNYNKNKII